MHTYILHVYIYIHTRYTYTYYRMHNIYILENINFRLSKKFMTFSFHLFDLV